MLLGGKAVLLIPQLTGLPSRLELEFCREIVWRLKVELVGYFFNAHICSGEQFLGTLQTQILLIGGRRQTRMLLEELTEVRVADTQFLGHLLNAE